VRGSGGPRIRCGHPRRTRGIALGRLRDAALRTSPGSSFVLRLAPKAGRARMPRRRLLGATGRERRSSGRARFLLLPRPSFRRGAASPRRALAAHFSVLPGRGRPSSRGVAPGDVPAGPGRRPRTCAVRRTRRLGVEMPGDRGEARDGTMLAVCPQCAWPNVAEAHEELPLVCRSPRCGARLTETDFRQLERPVPRDPPMEK